MTRSLNISLTDELHGFVDESSGAGTPFATPGEFVQALIRERMEQQPASSLRALVLEGYDDAIHGRSLALGSDLRSMVAEAKGRSELDWN